MNISKAMKSLKKLKNRASAISGKILKHNRTLESNAQIYNVRDLLSEYKVIVEEIVSTKCAIMKANVESGNYEKILRIGELKGLKTVLSNVDTSSGIDEDSFPYRADGNSPIFSAQLGEKDMDDMTRLIDEEIERYIEDLDGFNATTTI